MNAYELSEITYTHRVRGLTDEEIDLLIRQQQAEIESLKENFNKENPVKEVFNSEPVAYRWKSNLGYIYDIYDYGNGEPLYTHPVDAANTSKQYVDKTQNNRHDLTNEEILELWDWDSGEILATDLLDFADAILRKAQEK